METSYRKIDLTRPIRLAFLGCGFATHLHSKTLKSFKGEVERFYASRSLDKANDYNRKYRGDGFFSSYESAIESPEIDAVLIATPPHSHLELALQALQAGKHVIVEKPPFFHSRDFERVREAQQRHGCQAMVAENYFYKPLLVRLREIIRQGLIGDPLFIHINALKQQKTDNWRDDRELAGGGALFEGGIHWINFIANLGLTIDTIRGMEPSPQDSIDKSVLVTARYREGPVASLLYSWEVDSLFKGLRISRIFGRKGSLTFETNGIFLFVRGVKKRFLFPGFSDIAGYKGMFRDFFRALRLGEEPEFTLALARRDVQLIEAVYRSIERSKPENEHSDND